MLRPQGLFQHRLPPPVDWPQAYPPAPGAYPPGGQYPPGAPYQQGSPYPPPPGQYPATGAFQQAGPPQPWPQSATGSFQQAGPPQPWPQAATGSMPAQAPTGTMAGAPAPVPAAGPGQPGYPSDGQYAQGGAYPGPYGNGQYPGTQFGPGVPYGPGAVPPGGQGLLGKLPVRRPLVPVAVGAAVVIVAVAALALAAQGGSSPGTGNGTTAGATPAASSTGATALTQQQAATALSGLLAQSGTDHADVNAAVGNVEGCKGLAADARTFGKAAANRRALLARLAQLPGSSALPAAMIDDLTSGWQASAAVDGDLAKWAASEAGHCKKNDVGNPAYAASLPFDSKATNGKTAFVGQWNGLARKYGLATYQPSQI